MYLSTNVASRSGLPSRKRQLEEDDTSENPIPTPLLIPKIEKPDTLIEHSIPRDGESLPPQSKVQKSALGKEVAEQIAEASCSHDESLPTLSSFIEIKAEPLDEDEVDDSTSSNWKDPWLNNTNTNPKQDLANENLPKPTEEDCNSNDSVSTVGLHSPAQCSLVPADSQVESQNNDTIIKASALYSPAVEFYDDDETQDLPEENTVFTIVEDFDNGDIEDDVEDNIEGDVSNASDDNNDDEDDEDEEETFAVDMMYRCSNTSE